MNRTEKFQVFEGGPTERELKEFLSPAVKDIFGLKIDDSGDELRVYPRGAPVWWILVSSSIPVTVVGGHLIHKASITGLDSFDVLKIVMLFLSVTTFLGLAVAVGKYFTAKGDYLVLDRTRRKLLLPRLELAVDAVDIESVIQVQGWSVSKDKRVRDWVYETTILAKADNKRFARYPVVLSGCKSDITRISRTLAEFLGVSYQVVKKSKGSAYCPPLTWPWSRRKKSPN